MGHSPVVLEVVVLCWLPLLLNCGVGNAHIVLVLPCGDSSTRLCNIRIAIVLLVTGRRILIKLIKVIWFVLSGRVLVIKTTLQLRLRGRQLPRIINSRLGITFIA